jgi:hypothetical protein
MEKINQCTIGIKVLFQNKKYSIETFRNRNNSIGIVVIKDQISTDFTIRYDNGSIAFDNPYLLPKYIKEMVKKLYNNI